jgi:hypothetical protein
MGYEATYRGRIDLDPPMNANTWLGLQGRVDFGDISPNVHRTLAPVIVPVLSEDRRLVVAVEPGEGCKPSVMYAVLRDFAWFASLFTDEDHRRYRRFSGGFDGQGEDGERYRLTIGDTDPINEEVFDDPE